MKTLDEIRQGDWLQVHSGKQFWPLDPRAEEIDIGDIAHALGMLCRYGGHCQKYYSVAEHSVLVSFAVPEEFALYGLLHDAAEAYMLDLPAPIKRFVPDYKFYENVLQHLIFQKYGLSWPAPQEVKNADARILWNEKEALMADCEVDWNLWGDPLPDIKIHGYYPFVAKRKFLARFNELTHK